MQGNMEIVSIARETEFLHLTAEVLQRAFFQGDRNCKKRRKQYEKENKLYFAYMFDSGRVCM